METRTGLQLGAVKFFDVSLSSDQTVNVELIDYWVNGGFIFDNNPEL